MKFTLQQLAKQLELEFKGEANQEITGVAPLGSAKSDDLCFIQQEKYLRKISGSANIGQYCKIAGGVGVLGHLSIADNVTVTAMSLVTRDIKSPGVYSSGTPLLDNRDWHKNNARYKSLDRLTRTVVKLEKQQNKPSDGS
jgi:UDP-3-O-[3-hydroxymyristoyl] glucosamine N-acyltransferase